jgi:putative transposase
VPGYIIVVNEAHLRAVLGEFAAHYNAERPHRGLRLEPPVPADRRAAPSANRIHARPVLGGLHHVYEPAA